MIVDRLSCEGRTAAWRTQGPADGADYSQPAGHERQTEDERTEAPPVDPDSAVKLRGDPPRVMRLSRKAIGIASACGFALVGGALIYALQPAGRKGADELYNTDGVAVADNFAGAPKDYGQVPKLGPPLPGDLGRPILEAQRRGDVAALPPIGAGPPAAPLDPAATPAEAARQRAEQEREAARGSRLFFGGGSPGSGGGGLVGLPLSAEAQVAAPAAAPQSDTGRKLAFLERASDRRTVSGERLTGLASPSILQAGSVIPAALITGIRSDLPGLVTAQVTQNVYDSPTGRILLIPQGSRLIGDYDAATFGQSRILLAWNRRSSPMAVRSCSNVSQPPTRAGLPGSRWHQYHWGGVLKAALCLNALGVGSELGSGNDGDLARAVRRGTQDSINRAGEQIVSRELNVRPTLTIRPGFPVRVLVTRDLILGGAQ
jgi:type IV secretion system protein VirB10